MMTWLAGTSTSRASKYSPGEEGQYEVDAESLMCGVRLREGAGWDLPRVLHAASFNESSAG